MMLAECIQQRLLLIHPFERCVVESGYRDGIEVPHFSLPVTLTPSPKQTIANEVQHQVLDSFHVPTGTERVAPKTPQESIQRMKTSPTLPVPPPPAPIDVIAPDAESLTLWRTGMIGKTAYVIAIDDDGGARYEDVRGGTMLGDSQIVRHHASPARFVTGHYMLRPVFWRTLVVGRFV